MKANHCPPFNTPPVFSQTSLSLPSLKYPPGIQLEAPAPLALTPPSIRGQASLSIFGLTPNGLDGAQNSGVNHVSTYVCIYVYIDIDVYTYVHTYVYIHIYIYIYIYIHTYTWRSEQRGQSCMYVRMYICIHRYRYIHCRTYICICIYPYIYIYIHTHGAQNSGANHVCMYVCMFRQIDTHTYIHMYMYIHVHTYTRTTYIDMIITGHADDVRGDALL